MNINQRNLPNFISFHGTIGHIDTEHYQEAVGNYISFYDFLLIQVGMPRYSCF